MGHVSICSVLNSLQQLRNDVADALTAFAQNRLHTVALPALEAPDSQLPLVEVATSVVNAAIEFLDENPNTSLSEVKFVNCNSPLTYQVRDRVEGQGLKHCCTRCQVEQIAFIVYMATDIFCSLIYLNHIFPFQPSCLDTNYSFVV